MHILGPGRSAFLEFLRNLTPAVLLASIAFLLWARLDFTRVDLRNWGPTLAFFGCALTSALAFWANMWSFLDHAFAPLPRVEKAMRRLRTREMSNWARLRALAALTWRARPMILIEAVLVVTVVNAAMFAGVLTSISAAAAAWRNGLR